MKSLSPGLVDFTHAQLFLLQLLLAHPFRQWKLVAGNFDVHHGKPEGVIGAL